MKNKYNVDISIICAVKEEFDHLIKNLKIQNILNMHGFEYALGNYSEKKILILKTGIGVIKAAIATTFFLQLFDPSLLLFTGIAGALDSKLNIGDVVVGTLFFQAEEMTHNLFANNWQPELIDIPASQSLLEIVKNMDIPFDFKIVFGPIVSSEIYPAPPGFKDLFNEKKALAIDMESAAFAKVCQMFNKPFLVIRGISNLVVSTDDGEIDKKAIDIAARKSSLLVLSAIKNISNNFTQKLIDSNQRKSTQEKIDQLIQHYKLVPHIEGGFFREMYKSKDLIKPPTRFDDETRASDTSIYYLLTFDDFSAFHRIKSDETWYFHEGSNLLIHILDNDQKKLQTVSLCESLNSEDAFYQYTVLAGSWFAAELQDKNGYVLTSCNVSPGFEYKDFELARREELISQFKKYTPIIRRLTR